MGESIPLETLRAFARTIHAEARNYGFQQIDFVRLINEMLDLTADEPPQTSSGESPSELAPGTWRVDRFPLESERLEIRKANAETDGALLESWLTDRYGRHFLLSCATAQQMDLETLFSRPKNDLGIVQMSDGQPIGAVAYLDIDQHQKRAELRKLIGEPFARGKGFAEEATRLWISYGRDVLGLQKVYVSTLQTHLRNIQLNESIGFRVEGLLQREILINGIRYDVLRMGLSFEDGLPGATSPNGY